MGLEHSQPKAWLARGGFQITTDQKAAFEQLFLNDYSSRLPVLKNQVSEEILNRFAHPDPNATVEFGPEMLDFKLNHSGPIVLVMKRTFDTGWVAKNQAGLELPIVPVFGGLQGVCIDGDPKSSLQTNIRLQYSPKSLRWTLPLAAFGLVIIIWIGVKNQA